MTSRKAALVAMAILLAAGMTVVIAPGAAAGPAGTLWSGAPLSAKKPAPRRCKNLASAKTTNKTKVRAKVKKRCLRAGPDPSTPAPAPAVRPTGLSGLPAANPFTLLDLIDTAQKVTLTDTGRDGLCGVPLPGRFALTPICVIAGLDLAKETGSGLPPPATPDPAAVASAAALDLVADSGSVAVLPARALTGLETYFGLAIDDHVESDVSEAGIDLHLEISVTGYRWDFGDGATMTGGHGTPRSRESEIAHVYQRMGTYSPTVTVSWEVAYTADGEAGVVPGGVSTEVTGTVQVDQIRTRLTH